jgi:CHAT domain-containing protein/tetratricopeptide (TPR) repeat protein
MGRTYDGFSKLFAPWTAEVAMARRQWLRLRLALAATLLLIGAEPITGQAQGVADVTALNEQVRQLDSLGKYAEAVSLAEQHVALARLQHGEKHSEFATALAWLAYVYQDQGRTAEAEPLYKRALDTYEKALGPDNSAVAIALNNLATLYRDQGRMAEAQSLMMRAVAITGKLMGLDHPDVGVVLSNLAELYEAQGRYAEAKPLYQRSLAIRETALGRDHPDVAITLNNLAGLHASQSDWAGAVDYWRRGAAVIVRHAQRGTGVGHALTGKRKGGAERLSLEFQRLVKAAHRLAAQDDGKRSMLAAEMFQAAQWAQGSEAAATLAQMGARAAENDPALAALVRARQSAVEEWQKRDEIRSAAAAQAPDQRDRAAEAANMLRLDAIDKRIAEFDTGLEAKFPDYMALARPAPLSVQEVQTQLLAGEALVLFLDTREWKPAPEETFIWVVTKTDVRWVRSDLGTSALTREVAALRCGLDAGLWDDSKAAAHCRDLIKATTQRGAFETASLKSIPFDLTRAHALYRALFGDVEDIIQDKELLIVPSGPLTQLPFQVLTTAPSKDGNYKSATWLARSHAISVLPAVSSLKAMRRGAKLGAATKPMIGFGNPLLDGDPAARSWEGEWAKLARQKQSCPQTSWQVLASQMDHRRGVAPMVMRAGRPDLDLLRAQTPLQDTADELCAIAKDLKLAPDDVILGVNATETTVKRLSAEGRLANYRVVHLATHCTLAGQIEATSEPGLIFTPPKEQSDTDDGYLSASEVATLKLGADWVILSACNTAAGGAESAEALSILARAFVYAGARALLVSQWSVGSPETVKLITSAASTISRGSSAGRAEALRRGMLAMIDHGEAHPAYWAPFIVVGEGAAR